MRGRLSALVRSETVTQCARHLFGCRCRRHRLLLVSEGTLLSPILRCRTHRYVGCSVGQRHQVAHTGKRQSILSTFSMHSHTHAYTHNAT